MFSYVSRTVSQLPIACAPLACRVDLRHSLRVEWKDDSLGSQPSQHSPVLHKHETCDSALVSCLCLCPLFQHLDASPGQSRVTPLQHIRLIP